MDTHPASFRDPSGHIFLQDGVLYRQINNIYRENYDQLMSSGLYQALVDAGQLIPHNEVDLKPVENSYRVIRPTRLPFISYPYEWCFGQLKDAALLTLDIELAALDRGQTLKDASAYNIQFWHGRPIFIDTLSFEKYQPGQPWAAYRQFCQHFLAPLALMSRRDIRLQSLLKNYIDGLPLDLTCRLLPFRTRFNPLLASHIYLHAAGQRRFADRPVPVSKYNLPLPRLVALINSLRSAITTLNWQAAGTEWADYYDQTNYSDAAGREKEKIVTEYLNSLHPKTAWDLGANSGRYSALSSSQNIFTVAMDYDPAAIERLYQKNRSQPDPNLLPLVIDLVNPTPAIGWANRERESLLARGPADVTMSLALVHHLAIGNNTPWSAIVDLLSQLGRAAIVEFVPKSDSQVKRLLAGRPDIFPDYTANNFASAFQRKFDLVRRDPIAGSARTMYLFRRRS